MNTKYLIKKIGYLIIEYIERWQGPEHDQRQREYRGESYGAHRGLFPVKNDTTDALFKYIEKQVEKQKRVEKRRNQSTSKSSPDISDKL